MDALERIHSLMDARGWTEYKLAKESGLSQSTITNMFSRHTAPTIPTLESLCMGFGITLSQFFSENGNFVELDGEQLALFERWVKLTKRQKELILELVENMK